MKSLLLPFIVLLLVGCADPGEAIINVRSGDTLTAMKVSDANWKKVGGAWLGRPGNWSVSVGGGWRPADKEAVKAIEAYMEANTKYYFDD